jgi:hypothetical protein
MLYYSLVRDQEVSHFVPFVPVGWDRSLQPVEGTSLILVLVVSIPTAPTKLLSYQHVKRLLVFHLELLFQLNGYLRGMLAYARSVEPELIDRLREKFRKKYGADAIAPLLSA